MDEATLTKNAGFARLQANLGSLLRALAAFVEGRV
jgi:hypothetical protein